MPAAKKSVPKKSAARKRAAPVLLPDALAEAAWADADRALAQALGDLGEAQAAAAAGDDARLADALLLLDQSLSRIARRRGLSLFGVVGAIEAYAAQRHELTKPARAGKVVRIVAPGVKRGAEILVKARVKASRARKVR